MPCYGTRLYGRCPYDARCMRGITLAQVMDAIMEVFGGSSVPAAAEETSVKTGRRFA
jgi:hypothetical protein